MTQYWLACWNAIEGSQCQKDRRVIAYLFVVFCSFSFRFNLHGRHDNEVASIDGGCIG